MSPEIQNRGTSGPKKGHVSAKNFKKKINKNKNKKKCKKTLSGHNLLTFGIVKAIESLQVLLILYKYDGPIFGTQPRASNSHIKGNR